MTTSTPYAPARIARVQMRRLQRRASRTMDLVRAAVLVAALTMLALGLTGALRSGSQQVVSNLDATAQAATVR